MLKIGENFILRNKLRYGLNILRVAGCVHTWHNKYLLCVEYKSLTIQYGI